MIAIPLLDWLAYGSKLLVAKLKESRIIICADFESPTKKKRKTTGVNTAVSSAFLPQHRASLKEKGFSS